MFVPTYHLRRVTKTHHPEELILLGELTKFGRNADHVDVVLTSAVYSNMISRDHAVITGTMDPITRQTSYKIRDNSLNGTYIDDKRVKDEMTLNDSSVIKFGHMNGAAIKAGVAAPQANAEFSFVFEKCTPTRRYIGWEGYERRRTVVCTGDGKFMSETGEDHRTKRKSVSAKEPVSSTTAPVPSAFFIQHPPPILPPTTIFNAQTLPQNALYQYLQMQQQQAQMQAPWPGVTHGRPFPDTIVRQPQAAGVRPNGQIALSVGRPVGPFPPPPPLFPPSVHAPVDVKPSSSIAPIRSPPVECDSSVPSPPKTGLDSRTGHADSSQHSPRRAKDDDEDSFSVPDSPPRAPRPVDVAGRSVTNSPAPPSPRLPEKAEPPKEEKQRVVVSPKKPLNPGKAPKSGGGTAKRSSNKEVDRLLTDLTEGSFMMEARRKSQGGAGSERRKMLNEGKKSVKRPVSKNKLHRQLSSASSDEDSDDDEASGVPVRSSSSTVSRPSMVGKKASSSMSTSKGVMKKSGGGRGKKKESDESDPYEETDDDSEKETKNGKRKMSKKSSLLSEKKEKATPKAKPKKTPGRKKKKESDVSSGSDVEGEEGQDEYWDTENTKCEAPTCQLPKLSDVHWVQCDGCSKWSHNFCIFGTNLPYEGKTFFCGCGQAPVPVPTKKRKS